MQSREVQATIRRKGEVQVMEILRTTEGEAIPDDIELAIRSCVSIEQCSISYPGAPLAELHPSRHWSTIDDLAEPIWGCRLSAPSGCRIMYVANLPLVGKGAIQIAHRGPLALVGRVRNGLVKDLAMGVFKIAPGGERDIVQIARLRHLHPREGWLELRYATLIDQSGIEIRLEWDIDFKNNP